MSNSGKAKTTMGLLQLLIWSYVLHSASALECHGCAADSSQDMCNCKKSPEKRCFHDPGPAGVYTRASLKALQSQLDRLTGINKTKSERICAIITGLYNGQETFVRTKTSVLKYRLAGFRGPVPVSAICQLQPVSIVHFEKKIKIEYKEGCMCNTDWCNGNVVSSSHKVFQWSRTSLLTLIALSIGNLATSKIN